MLPGYTPAVAPARIFLLSGAAIGIVNLASIGAVAAGRQHRLPAYAVAALTLNLGLVARRAGTRRRSRGGGPLVPHGHLLFAAAVLRLNAREGGIAEPGRFAVTALLPLVWCTAALLAAARLSPPTDLGSEAAALGIYLALLLPLLPLLRREWKRFGGEPARG